MSNNLPLLARVDEINNPYSNFIDIFEINTSDDVDTTIRKLKKLQLKYHPDKCSESNGFTSDQASKCEVISKKLTEITENLENSKSYNTLILLPPPPPPPQPSPSQEILSIGDSLQKVTDVENQEQQLQFYNNLFQIPKILKLARAIMAALKEKYGSVGSVGSVGSKIVDDSDFYKVLQSVSKNITLSFFIDGGDDGSYDFHPLKKQILAFIEESEYVNGKYKLHDIIDLLGNDREKLGNDYCVALNIFFSLMNSVFGYTNVEKAPTFGYSSFYTHKKRCDNNPSYSPKKGSSSEFKSTRTSHLKDDSDTKKFKELQKQLNVDNNRNRFIIPPSVEEENPGVPSGGRKSRRRRARKTRRGRTRKSKSKTTSKTHRRRRHSRVRKHKKNTYTRRR